jgi:DNA repair protein RadD
MSAPLPLRPYQAEAVRRTVEHFRKSTESACIVLPTGAGKSVVIAELIRKARGRVLCLAHVKELCQQNFEKYQALGGESARPAGLFSAGLGSKDACREVVFGSVQSVAQNLAQFDQPISLLIVDECHRVSGKDSSQYGAVIDHLGKVAAESAAPPPKVLGLTATPYRLGLGFTYRRHFRGFFRSTEERPFEVCVYEVSLREMVESGFLTPPRVLDAPIAQYDFSSLGSEALFDDSAPTELNALLVRHRRVTESIVEQIQSIALNEGRRGVMIFAATVEHAKEIAGYLPAEQTALVLGETDGARRDVLIEQFSAGNLRYLVNVAVLTTGFDAPHVDFIALLRRTESVSLFGQIVGRGLRLFEGKQDCLVIDYAGNGFDVFSPEVGELRPSEDSQVVEVECPACGHVNQFWGQKDETGRVVEHFGRRCQGQVDAEDGKPSRCSYRFRFKECQGCGAENDIAARSCSECKTPLVDPDTQLREALQLKDALVLRVAGTTLTLDGTRLKITYHDEEGTSVSELFDFQSAGQRHVFNREFGRRIASGRRPLDLDAPEQALALANHLPVPDFVVARKKKKGRHLWFRVEARIFDYEGRRRRAHEL